MQKRPSTMHPEGVSAQDCLDDQRLRVPLQLDGFQAEAVLEGWASFSGADCSSQHNRQSGVCWRLVDGIALQSSTTVHIPVRRLLEGTQPSSARAPGEVGICSSVQLSTLSVHFLYFAPGQFATPTVQKSLDLEVDTIGNSPPAEATIFPGDSRVAMQWRDPAVGTTTTAVRGYCTPVTRATGDASCSSPSLPEGAVLPATLEANLRCGAVVGDAGRTIVVDRTADGKPLENDVSYGFALASVDDFGNVGPLSSTLCEAPRAGAELPSARASGDGGGDESGCSASPARTSGPGAALGTLLTLACVIAIQRRRHRAKAAASSARNGH